MTTNYAGAAAVASLIDGWTDLWNGDLQQAQRICADEVTVRFGGRAIAAAGDDVRTPADLAALIREFRATREGLSYSVVEARGADDFAYCVWDAALGELRVGGVDAFRIVDGKIAHAWSVTGERALGSA